MRDSQLVPLRITLPHPTVLLACSGLLMVVSASCAVGPDYRSPALPTVDHYLRGERPQQTIATPAPSGAAQTFVYGSANATEWWRRFGSQELSQLVDRAFSGNFDLQAAEARLRQAQQLLQATIGLRYPEVNISAGHPAIRSFCCRKTSPATLTLHQRDLTSKRLRTQMQETRVG